MPLVLRQQLDQLAQGSFVDRGVNVLALGLPGTGRTHALCALGHRLVESGRSVPFVPDYRLVQELLAAKRDLALPRQLRKLDNFDFLFLDDLGLPASGHRGIGGSLHPHSRTLRTKVPGHNVKPGLLGVAHCLTKFVTFKKWLPQIECYRKIGRRPLGRKHRQDGETGVAGNHTRPLPGIVQEG